jgi:hypothetical protein
MIALRQDVIMSQTERDRPSVLRAARERVPVVHQGQVDADPVGDEVQAKAQGHPEPDDLRGAGRTTDTIVTRA